MDTLTGFLIVVIIVLVICVLRAKKSTTGTTTMRSWDCIDRSNGELTTVKMQMDAPPARDNIEATTHRENSEYFCGGNDSVGVTSMCSDDDTHQYAIDPFGAPNMEYKDWVTAQAVDPQVLKNHSEFIKDRFLGNSQNVTGRTYSPDYHDSYDPQPWIGIRGRPQAVAICNPTQMPDMDISLFAQKPKISWDSGSIN